MGAGAGELLVMFFEEALALLRQGKMVRCSVWLEGDYAKIVSASWDEIGIYTVTKWMNETDVKIWVGNGFFGEKLRVYTDGASRCNPRRISDKEIVAANDWEEFVNEAVS